ncbi:craniofacial development protein 2-like [Diaphorina citri]|uniref:Craniofacial development protein 2-like n=1 Tax=Diaphorina citri TaxID=121845 RepID=A0A1S3D828_DIACI|nr:craniofacial development protein 2-like [Diaphorina citri]
MAGLTTKQIRNSSSIGSPGGNVLSNVKTAILKQVNMRIATWNVKTLNAAGKTDNAIKEMKRMNIDILGISEMRWPDTGEVDLEGHRAFYSGRADGKHEEGVGMIMTKEVAACVRTFTPISERILLIQLEGRPVNINIIQVYAPTLDKPDETVEEMYATINDIMSKLKKNEINIVMGDFNSKVGEGKTSDAVGPFGLGERNKRGDALELFASTHDMVITNTWFKQPKRRLYTCKSPQDKPDKVMRNQIDFLLINKRFRNSCVTIRTYPGADIVSDHNPLVGDFRIRMKKAKKKTMPPFDLAKLKYQETKAKVV